MGEAVLGFLWGSLSSPRPFIHHHGTYRGVPTLKALGATPGYILRYCFSGDAVRLRWLSSGGADYQPDDSRCQASYPLDIHALVAAGGCFSSALAMCALASILSVKAAITVEPAKVFRA